MTTTEMPTRETAVEVIDVTPTRNPWTPVLYVSGLLGAGTATAAAFAEYQHNTDLRSWLVIATCVFLVVAGLALIEEYNHPASTS